MFRITAHYDDRFHPLQGDVRTVASVAEAMAIVEDCECDLSDLLPGEWCGCCGFGVEYIVERI
jgi:hypothetical protein